MIKLIKRRIELVRIHLLNRMLDLINFKIITGHRIYTSNLSTNSTVIDLGTNKGEFLKEIQKKYNCKCFAVEPNLQLFQNISLEDSQKLNAAICKVDGPVSFFLSVNDEASSLVQDLGAHWGKSSEVIIEGVSWKKVMELFNLENKVIDLLKVDIEGAELDLIESFDEEDIKSITQITVEFHDWLNKDLHLHTVKMIDKLVANGFKCFISAPSHDWPVEALFIRMQNSDLNFIQQLALKIFNRFSFLNYKQA